MKSFLGFKITVRRGDDDQNTEDSKSPMVISREGWRVKARKLWARLRGPRKEPKKDEAKEVVEALIRRIAELEEKLEQQGAASLAHVLLVSARNVDTSSLEDDRTTVEVESSDGATIPDSRDGRPPDAAVSGAQNEVVDRRGGDGGRPTLSAAFAEHLRTLDLRNLPARFRCCPPGLCRHDVSIAAAEGVLRPEVSWSSLRTYQTGLSGESETPGNATAGATLRRGTN
ncbi:hypothetical protein TWF281_008088 [Arthrobotrys megalospora]